MTQQQNEIVKAPQLNLVWKRASSLNLQTLSSCTAAKSLHHLMSSVLL